MNTLGAWAAILLGLVGFGLLLSRYTFWRPWRPRDLPRILMYHHVDDAAPSGMNCPPSAFEKHLVWLMRAGYRFATVSELAAHRSGKVVALTFDDGYRDNYEKMFPLVAKYKAKATIYLAPRLQAADKLEPAQIAEMSGSGLVEFGAHTLTHVNLAKVPDEEARFEISESKKAVESLTGRPCASFSYPYGRFTENTVRHVKDAGFANAVTVRKRIEAFARNPHELPRVSIHGAMDRIQFHIALRTGRYKL